MSRSLQNKISSRSSVYYKKVFPVLWFGFLAVFVTTSFLAGATQKDRMFLVIPIIMGAFGFFLMKKLIWDLMDEVYDCGDELLVKYRGQEARIRLSDIMNVNSSVATNPPRVTLRLANPSIFGSEISFSPIRPFTLNPFAKNEIAEDLIVRVDRARAERAQAERARADPHH